MREFVLLSAMQDAEQWSDYLLDLGALSVSVEDAHKDSELERPLFGEPGTEIEVSAWDQNYLISLWPQDIDESAIEETFKEIAGQEVITSSWREVPDQDWVRLTQSQFDPIRLGERIWIVPSWHMDDPHLQVGMDSIQLQLDPGLAFGTGSHPTTRLCAEWLEKNIQVNQSVLDYGCGSGILAMIASKLGASPVIGTDIDEQAVQASIENAKLNQTPIDIFLPDELPEGCFDMVVANILSNPLKVLAPLLCHRLAPHGHLVLSGILERQEQEIIQCYAPWIRLSVWQRLEGWVCLHGQI